jgi:hypothetical protein
MTPEELNKEAWMAWEKDNRIHPRGINPDAYTLGYKAAAKKMLPIIEQLQRDSESMNQSLQGIGEKNIKEIFEKVKL